MTADSDTFYHVLAQNAHALTKSSGVVIVLGLLEPYNLNGRICDSLTKKMKNKRKRSHFSLSFVLRLLRTTSALGGSG